MSSCCDCNLITQTDFFGIVDVPQNIDSIKLNIAIRETKINVKRFICPELWDELCEQIEDDSLTELNEGLLCKIKDVWVRYAYAELLENNTITLTTDGVVRKFSEESEQVGFDNATKHANKWRMFGNNYIEQLKKYLSDNKDANELYMECHCLCGGDKVNASPLTPFGGFC